MVSRSVMSPMERRKGSYYRTVHLWISIPVQFCCTPRSLPEINEWYTFPGRQNFSVSKDEKKPFVVHAGPVEITVTGTKFNVEAYSGGGMVTTTLENGSVIVSKANDTGEIVHLRPNEQLVYHSSSDSFVLSEVESSDYASWTNGICVLSTNPSTRSWPL